MEIDLPKNHILLTSSNEITEICKPLNEFLGITSFHYLQINPDLSRLNLGTDPEWQEFFYKNCYKYCIEGSGVVEGHLWNSSFVTTFYDGNNDKQLIQDAKDWGYGEGIVIANQLAEKNAMEMVWLGWKNTASATQMMTTLSQVDLLQKFLIYFRDQAKDLIDTAAKSPITLPFLNRNTQSKSFCFDQNKKNNFLSSINQKKLETYKKLSKRELECIYHTAQDKSAKQIADLLCLSQRTIEHHIENAKSKLGFRKKSSLVHFLSNL